MLLNLILKESESGRRSNKKLLINLSGVQQGFLRNIKLMRRVVLLKNEL
jgi:hypothetical protein